MAEGPGGARSEAQREGADRSAQYTVGRGQRSLLQTHTHTAHVPDSPPYPSRPAVAR